jgi:hypothetical protein
MSDSEESDFSDNASGGSSDGEAEEVGHEVMLTLLLHLA